MSGLKLELGKFYIRADGVKVGPVALNERHPDNGDGPFRAGSQQDRFDFWNYDEDGTVSQIADDRPELSIVSEAPAT